MLGVISLVGFDRDACGCLLTRYRNTVTGVESLRIEAPSQTCRVHHRGDLVDEPATVKICNMAAPRARNKRRS